jgi:hypothetical protein
MDCSEIKYYLKDYAGGLLPREAAKIIEKHLNGCKKCRITVDELNLSRGSLTGEEEPFWIEFNENQDTEEKQSYKTRINYTLKTRHNEIDEPKGNKILILCGILFIISLILIFLVYINRQKESLPGKPIYPDRSATFISALTMPTTLLRMNRGKP